MNEAFNKYLMSILERTDEFISSELPVIAEEILTISLIEYIVWAVFNLTAIYVIYRAVKWLRAITEDCRCESDRGFGRALGYIIGGMLTLCLIGSIVSKVLTIVKIYIAPKLFLLEYASSLV